MSHDIAALDLSPAGAAAPRGTRIVRHAAMEAKLTARNGEQLLLNLVIPLATLILGMLLGDRMGLDTQVFPMSVMALSIWSAAFTSLAINTAFERRYGVLERLVSTPLTKSDLLVGKAGATAANALGQIVILAIVAACLGWRPSMTVGGVLLAIADALVATLAFAGLALALAGRARAEATLGIANLFYIVAAAGGALLLPVDAYPSGMRPILAALPWGALGEGLRAAASGQVLAWPLLVLVCWAVLNLLLARKAFSWMS